MRNPTGTNGPQRQIFSAMRSVPPLEVRTRVGSIWNAFLPTLNDCALPSRVLVDRNARGDDVAGFLQLVESARIEDAAVVEEWRPVDPFEDPDVEGVESPEHTSI